MLIKCPYCLKVHDKYIDCDTKKNNQNMKSDIEKECDKFYSSGSWTKKREEALKENNYLCEICYQLENIKLAESVHHIIKIRDEWSKRLDLDNLICVCNEHHRLIEGMTRDEIIKYISLQNSENI